jgi:excisionase family DNA binding protein
MKIRMDEAMAQKLFSVEQVAERLGLHVRTVRNYVRDGKLKAVRIGKQYRIAQEDLEAFTGRPMEASVRETVRRSRHVEVSSIVEIDAISPDLAGRMTNGILAAAGGRHKDGAAGEPVRIDTRYDEERARLKVIVTGGITTTTNLLGMISLYLESRP